MPPPPAHRPRPRSHALPFSLVVATAAACAPRAEPSAAPAASGGAAEVPSEIASAPPAPAASASALEARAPAASPAVAVAAAVETLAVPADRPASIVWGAQRKPPRIVFLPGLCSNAGAYLWGFAETAQAHGGVVAIDGDRPCGASGDFHSISSDPLHEEPRIEAALRAAGRADGDEPVILIGYSLGATLAERLAERRPERYRHLALIGSPKDPQVARVRAAAAVATMSCSLDVPQRMRGAVPRLAAAGVAARYFEMPGCTHGNLAEGDRVFDEMLRWMASPS